jgi:hypothetical protein
VGAAAGEQACPRFVEFFTASIRNKNARDAYSRAGAADNCHTFRAAALWRICYMAGRPANRRT